ncbi:MAG: LuxR C-terminal-related transcriptional regulator [Gammaproteobacteria bacterium]|nr:LuxR C-terminal-related transcriptional regulator [Gammaproteobacteria bacterium]
MSSFFYKTIEQATRRIWSLVPTQNFGNDALTVAAEAVRADKAVLVNAFLSGERGGCLASPHLTNEQISHYNAHYAPINPLARELMFKDGIAQDTDGINWNALKRTEYFDGWVKPFWGKEIATLVESDGDEMVIASFANDSRRSHFDATSRAMLKQIIPQLAKAQWAHRHLGPTATSDERPWQPSFQRHASVTLDRRLRIIECNDVAQTLLPQLRIFSLDHNTLTARKAEFAAALRAAAADKSAAQRSFTCLDRPGMIRIDVIPCQRLPSGTPILSPCVLLIITNLSDGADTAKPTPELTGLTHTEIEVVIALERGLSLQEIAEQRNRSIHTVRTQLKAIYRKLGVHSKVELVAHLNSSLKRL